MFHGKSLALIQNSFLRPPGTETDGENDQAQLILRQKRLANVYDAVAGRVSVNRFQSSIPSSKNRDAATYSNAVALRPEEVLFRRLNAPTRYEENDFYFAHELLPPDCPLPSSDLLEAIHAYSADFYDLVTDDHGETDCRSMDETALIAMGILLEEMAKESLGETGDLVLVEGERLSDDEGRFASRTGRRAGRKRANSVMGGALASSGDDRESATKGRKSSKRRKLSRKASATDGETGDEKT